MTRDSSDRLGETVQWLNVLVNKRQPGEESVPRWQHRPSVENANDRDGMERSINALHHLPLVASERSPNYRSDKRCTMENTMSVDEV